ncbi:MAG: trypsin-like peptidase domain-containing protein [Deltaproteobacteria bacterium]|nr:trypsin-like peptidase domain-containing protein [Deltaproteobacteria bacterium]
MNLSELSDGLAQVVRGAGDALARVEGRCVGASATVWSSDGALVTANHLLERDDSPTVHLGDGRSFTARVVGRDPGTDLALLRVDAQDLTPARWDDGDGLAVGHLVVMLGRPGRSVRATLGMVSTLGESVRTASGARLDRYLEVDGSLPRGYGGGALVDVQGRVLGMNTPALLPGGATVPTVTLRRVLAELQTHGRVTKGYLGVGVYPVRLSPEDSGKVGQSAGVVVVSLEGGGPAEKGGLVLGDVLLSLDGHPTAGPGDLLVALEGRVNVSVTAKILRGGVAREVTLVTGSRPA